MNEYSIFSLSQMINSSRAGNVSFSIIDKIEYVIDLFSIKAAEKGITLILMKEPCFPKEVTGNKIIFELILATVFKYLVQKVFKGEIKLYAKVKSPFEGQLLLGFDFECPSNEVLSVGDLKNSLMSSNTVDMAPVFPLNTWQNPAHTVEQPALLIKCLNGNFEIPETDSSTIKLEIELPFSTQTSMEVQPPENKINIFRVERQTEFMKAWTHRVGPSELTLSPRIARRLPKITRTPTEKGIDEDIVERTAKNKIRMKVSKLSQKLASPGSFSAAAAQVGNLLRFIRSFHQSQRRGKEG